MRQTQDPLAHGHGRRTFRNDRGPPDTTGPAQATSACRLGRDVPHPRRQARTTGITARFPNTSTQSPTAPSVRCGFCVLARTRRSQHLRRSCATLRHGSLATAMLIAATGAPTPSGSGIICSELPACRAPLTLTTAPLALHWSPLTGCCARRTLSRVCSSCSGHSNPRRSAVAHHVDKPFSTEASRQPLPCPIVLLWFGSAPLRDGFFVARIETRFVSGDIEGTTSSSADVPPHTPHAVPSHQQFRQRNQACSSVGLGRPLGRDTRGERRPLRWKTSTQAWSTSVPCGTSLPPRAGCLGE
jgi:hypothetical protein